MKIEFDVWKNARNEVHLTSDDKRLVKPINIRAKDGLVSTGVLETALTDGAPDTVPPNYFQQRDHDRAVAALERERALRHDAEAERSSLLATIARLRGELAELRADGCGMTECGMLGTPGPKPQRVAGEYIDTGSWPAILSVSARLADGVLRAAGFPADPDVETQRVVVAALHYLGEQKFDLVRTDGVQAEVILTADGFASKVAEQAVR